MPILYSRLSTANPKATSEFVSKILNPLFSSMTGPFSGRKYWLTVILLITVAVIILFQYRLNASVDYSIYYSLLKNVENGEECQIPKIDPFDETIKRYLKPGHPLICKNLQPELTKVINGKILINLEELTKSGYSLESITCRKRCFWRMDSDDITLDYSSWSNLENATAMTCEFMEIACWKQFPPVRIYTNLHHWITPKSDIINPGKASTNPNVILFVLDSISQSNWKRYLPKTLKALENLYNATISEGFTKVGDNSFPNAAAFLTGKRVQTVGYESEMASDMSDKFFDDWPIIWKDFKQKGYATYYAEDYPDYNLFKYLSNGFQKSPTDHYFRPFWLQLYGSFLHRRSTHLCYGNRQCHQIQLEYLKQFVESYTQKAPMFALNWLTELGHDWLEQVSIGDSDIAEFFKDQHKNLKDSFVFVFADHGHRFDPIRQSMIGRIEERMPFFSISIPKNLRKRVPKLGEIVAENSKKLTSFWDLYITLKDILDLTTTNSWETLNNAIQDERKFREYSPRGLSLLRPIPSKRNCQAAGIPEDFCICQRETQISVNDSRVQEAAEKVVQEVNRLLEPEAEQCSELFLDRIEHAQTFLPNVKIALDGSGAGFYVMYRVALIVKPSNAFLEGTVRHLISDENDYTIVGDINRINKYGNQSSCVNIPLLRKYCFCKANVI